MSVCLSLSLSSCLSVRLCLFLVVCLSVCISLFLSVCLYLPLSSCLYICLPVFMSVCLPVSLSVCLCVCLSVCLSACISSRLSSCLSFRLSRCLYVCLYMSVFPSFSLSSCLPVSHYFSLTSTGLAPAGRPPLRVEGNARLYTPPRRSNCDPHPTPPPSSRLAERKPRLAGTVQSVCGDRVASSTPPRSSPVLCVTDWPHSRRVEQTQAAQFALLALSLIYRSR